MLTYIINFIIYESGIFRRLNTPDTQQCRTTYFKVFYFNSRWNRSYRPKHLNQHEYMAPAHMNEI